ncbi:hypothetical protein J6590_084088 [Homalodisca vitripennis]|nr:hypothetical protein J6590_084088 [Homalodisca vitripennis]
MAMEVEENPSVEAHTLPEQQDSDVDLFARICKLQSEKENKVMNKQPTPNVKASLPM